MLDCIWNPPDLDAEAALDVVRGLGLQLEVLGKRIEEGVERRSRRNALIDIRGTERARGAAEYREYVVEAMFETDMQGVLRLAAVERECLSASKAKGAVGS